MCDVVTALSVGSMAFGAMGAYKQSQAEQDSANYQAAVARNNAQISEWQAQDAIKRGETAEAQQRLRAKQFKGSQTARLAANGIDISEGSALNMLSDTDWMGEQDALNVRDNAAREAYTYRQQGSNSSANAGLLKYRADAENPLMSSGASIFNNLGGVANNAPEETKKTLLGDTENMGLVANKWYKMINTLIYPIR